MLHKNYTETPSLKSSRYAPQLRRPRRAAHDPSMTNNQARHSDGTYGHKLHPDAEITLGHPTAASVLNGAAGTEKDPWQVKRPEGMSDKRYVEVWADREDVEEQLDQLCIDVDLREYESFYISGQLTGSADVDIMGVRADGTETTIAYDFEPRERFFNPDASEYMDFRPGYTDTMPEYASLKKQWRQAQLDASSALLEEAGITVEVDPHSPRDFMLHRDGKRLRYRDEPARGRFIETRNWGYAGDEDLADFLGGDVSKEGLSSLGFAVGHKGRALLRHG